MVLGSNCFKLLSKIDFTTYHLLDQPYSSILLKNCTLHQIVPWTFFALVPRFPKARSVMFARIRAVYGKDERSENHFRPENWRHSHRKNGWSLESRDEEKDGPKEPKAHARNSPASGLRRSHDNPPAHAMQRCRIQIRRPCAVHLRLSVNPLSSIFCELRRPEES